MPLGHFTPLLIVCYFIFGLTLAGLFAFM